MSQINNILIPTIGALANGLMAYGNGRSNPFEKGSFVGVALLIHRVTLNGTKYIFNYIQGQGEEKAKVFWKAKEHLILLHASSLALSAFATQLLFKLLLSLNPCLLLKSSYLIKAPKAMTVVVITGLILNYFFGELTSYSKNNPADPQKAPVNPPSNPNNNPDGAKAEPLKV